MVSGKQLNILSGHTSDVNAIAITPDGKKAISVSRETIVWDLESGKRINTLSWHTHRITSVAIMPDGKKAISVSLDKTCILWDIESGKALARLILDSSIEFNSLFSTKILLCCSSGEVVFLVTYMGLQYADAVISTIRRIWDFELKRYQQPSTDCPLCGHRFEPPQSIIQTIIQTLNENNIKPDQSPCLELPDEAWKHSGLLGECPECHEKLKFNPFFGSDQRGIEEYFAANKSKFEFQEIFDNAENAFNEENWQTAYNLYLKLVQQGNYDLNYLRYNMAICRLNCLTTDNPEIINNINILTQLLRDKGANDKAQLIADQLKERLDAIKQEELTKKKAEAPWWKKIF